MLTTPTFKKCAFCPNFGEIPPEGGDVPMDWFFVARPRRVEEDEQTETMVITPGGVDTIAKTVQVDRWLFCSGECLGHVAELLAL